MGSEWMLAILGTSFLAFLFLGTPISYIVEGLAVILGAFFWSPMAYMKIADSIYRNMTDPTLMSIVLFVFMGFMLESSGIGQSFYRTMRYWTGRLKGGLAIGTIFSLTAIAAMTPSGVGTVLLGGIAVPNMLKYGYDEKLAIGTVCAGGMLGMLIVPSIMIIIYSVMVGESVGKMFAAALIPGVLMAVIFSVQILIRCQLNPELGPPLDERITFHEKIKSLVGIVYPVILICSILAGIYSGTFTPTEASSVGAVGAIIGAIINRNFNLKTFREAAIKTLRISSMVYWLMVSCKFFSSLFIVTGVQGLARDFFTGLSVSPIMVIILMQLSLFILCMFIDDYPVMLLFAPIFVPIIKALGFDSTWFGVLFILSMNIAWLTPPYGFNLFYAKAIRPSMHMIDINRGVFPFIICQIICVILVMMFPQLALWLPGLVIK